MTNKELIEYAFIALKTAYTPYSGYKVGAALLTKNGKVYLGCNIENASYSPTVCAERTAFFKAISEGEREFLSIAIVGGKDSNCETFFMPCGVCRQVMSEFCEGSFIVLIGKNSGDIKKLLLSELLPYSFDLK